MGKYIDKELLWERLKRSLTSCIVTNTVFNTIRAVIDDMPTIEVTGEWIPVSEGLPKKSGYYIVSFNDAVNPCVNFDNGKWYYVDFNIIKEYGEHEVIAWMPLPAPYKGGDME